MAKPKVVGEKWEIARGRPPGHVVRLIREMQSTGQCVLGIQGKAADQPAYSLRNILLADVTGDAISAAPERAALWSGLVRDRSSPSVTPAASEADKIFRARMSQNDVDAPDSLAKHDILPGPDLGSGIDAILHQMADASLSNPLGKRLVSFTEIVSHLGFKIELLMGGNEGPQAIVQCKQRYDRFISNVHLPERVRNAHCPVESVVTITVPHLVVFAQLLADTLSNLSGGRKDENAGAAPTAPASTLGRPDTTSEVADTDSHQGTTNTPEGKPNSHLSATPSLGSVENWSS